MHKQTIEVEVHDGKVIYKVKQINDDDSIQLNISIQDKEPKFIEIREYLCKDRGRITLEVLNKNSQDQPGYIESFQGFIRWVDTDWRKVYVD